MREYNSLQALYMSFYSRSLYRDVAYNWGGSVVLYLLLLLTICWGLMMFKLQAKIDVNTRHLAQKYVMQVPDLTVKKGLVSTPENRPYLIKNGDSVIMVIDTSGKYSTLENVPSHTDFLLTQNAIYYYDSQNNLRMQKIPANFSFNFVPAHVKSYLEKFAGNLWMLIFPIFLLCSFIYRLMQALIYGVIGKIFASILYIPLRYVQTLKLSMVAVTPAIVLGDILIWTEAQIPFQWLLLFFVAMVYLIFAIKSNRQTDLIVR